MAMGEGWGAALERMGVGEFAGDGQDDVAVVLG